MCLPGDDNSPSTLFDSIPKNSNVIGSKEQLPAFSIFGYQITLLCILLLVNLTCGIDYHPFSINEFTLFHTSCSMTKYNRNGNREGMGRGLRSLYPSPSQ